MKYVALSAFLTLSAFCAVLYSSCTKDECKGVTCLNGGTCSGGTCTCPTGYEGTSCETESRTKFVKSWSATDVIGTTTLSYVVNISSGGSTDVTKVVIGNAFSDDFFVIGPITANVTGNTINIPLQNPDHNKYSLTGTGTIAAGKITWSYTIKNDSTSATQVYSASWM